YRSDLAGYAELGFKCLADILVAGPVNDQYLRLGAPDVGPEGSLAGENVRNLLLRNLLRKVGKVHKHADPIPRDGHCRKARGFSSGDSEVGLARLDHLDRFRIGVPHDIEIGSRVGFFKGAGEEIDGPELRPVA